MIDQQFEETVILLYGKKGKDWLNNLSNLVTECIKKWELKNVQEMPNLSLHYVLSAFSKKLNKPVVVKLRIDQHNFILEQEALVHLGNFGCVKLYDTDKVAQALLIEQCIPGNSLKSFFPHSDAKAVIIAANIIKRFQTAQLTSLEYATFPKLSDWLKIFNSPWVNQLSAKHQQHVQSYLHAEFVNDTSRICLLHGDLHHANVLLNGKEWVAIDPKGIVGDAIFEMTSFICNPIDELITQSNVLEIITQRIHLFADLLNYDKKEIKRWCSIRALLGVCWSFEDKLPHEPWQKLAELLDLIPI